MSDGDKSLKGGSLGLFYWRDGVHGVECFKNDGCLMFDNVSSSMLVLLSLIQINIPSVSSYVKEIIIRMEG